MLRRRFIYAFALLAIFSIAATVLSAQKQERKPRKFKVPPQSARIEVTVVRDANDKPVENAAVIFHPVEGDHDKGTMELKTNEEGKTVIDVIPVGDTVRMQVIARGFQTAGQEFKVEKESYSFEIRLKRPGSQYSIYKARQGSTEAGKNAAPATKPADEKSTQPEADKSKPQAK